MQLDVVLLLLAAIRPPQQVRQVCVCDVLQRGTSSGVCQMASVSRLTFLQQTATWSSRTCA
jgi:hypothetical protein